MKILHTSDWHFGRNIENISREAEQIDFVNELCGIASEENVDVVVVAGDIFDTFNPPIWAERLYYEALKRLSDDGRGVIVISGNHDTPQGLCSAGKIAVNSGVIMSAYPSTVVETGNYGGILKVIDSGEGWFKIETKNGEKAVIASLPYPSESRIANVIEYSEGEDNIKKDYNARLKELMEVLCTHFEPDTANVLVSHIYINGGKPSDSERNFQLGGAYAVNSDTIPAQCDYVALGHLHRPQKISACMSPTYYSGSPLAYSFSEAGYAKSVYVVDIEDHKAEVKAVELKCGRALVSVNVNGIDEAVKWCNEYANEKIWAELKIITDAPITTEQQKLIHDTCKAVVSIQPVVEAAGSVVSEVYQRKSKPLEESFADFYKLKMGADVPENIKQAFAELRGE
ncbi:MAG: exonuclease subunit SbcD [Bacillota bacterium]|nr:exonuclease subunit SbcD [Bacillota bacterium]